MNLALFLKYIVSPIFSALASALYKRLTNSKPKLIGYLIHASAIQLKPPINQLPNNQLANPITVNSHSIVLRNIGNETAHNLRIGHYVLPDFVLNPNVSYYIANNTEIVIPTLAPNESLTVSYLYFPTLTWQHINSYAKSDEGLVTYPNVVPTIQQNRLFIIGRWILLIIGISTLLNLATIYLLDNFLAIQ